MKNSHWLKLITISKFIGISALIIHLIGIPLFFAYVEFKDFYMSTDFLKVISLTTSIGAITIFTFTFILFYCLVIANKKNPTIKYTEPFRFIASTSTFCLSVADVVLVTTYLVSGQFLLAKSYVIIFAVLVIFYSIVLIHKPQNFNSLQ